MFFLEEVKENKTYQIISLQRSWPHNLSVLKFSITFFVFSLIVLLWQITGYMWPRLMARTPC